MPETPLIELEGVLKLTANDVKLLGAAWISIDGDPRPDPNPTNSLRERAPKGEITLQQMHEILIDAGWFARRNWKGWQCQCPIHGTWMPTRAAFAIWQHRSGLR